MFGLHSWLFWYLYVLCLVECSDWGHRWAEPLVNDLVFGEYLVCFSIQVARVISCVRTSDYIIVQRMTWCLIKGWACNRSPIFNEESENGLSKDTVITHSLFLKWG